MRKVMPFIHQNLMYYHKNPRISPGIKSNQYNMKYVISLLIYGRLLMLNYVTAFKGGDEFSSVLFIMCKCTMIIKEVTKQFCRYKIAVV
ncbi:hypothetical protein J2795_001750 [Chryseobacterium bernardetii]|uniref:Uncharacterized protein n=2 Tax=Chryseobacterium TaxID=59732 RepID=A0A543EI70_9FLAO|nr:hypothetical protein [Chryseobacterium vietnamense]MDR6441050.1 hypothetical protein [Chryseobacterium bernardetii]TQM21274.1 hypothetical protein FB551_0956 [Chryseobacterium aquifrigidense]